ncbi:hypothetical protein GCM10023185_35000 [Hymenobacter saemangeumensis]|uniref:Lipoprotein n=1 Tax=Hymenobacter saemangeumensis TaxID=1084522 RepID=A0ABP8IP68_9BACT
MQVSTLFRLGFGLLLLTGSLSVVSCKTEDVRPRDRKECGKKPTTTTSSDTTRTGGNS